MFRLLLLDDERVVLNGIQKVFSLRDYGFEVVGALQQPLEALAQLEALRPDLIITDVKMPKMDGLEFSTRVKQILPEVEIVILSGYSDFSYAQTAVRLGVRDYLLKPIKKDDFSKMLKRMYARIEAKQSRESYFQSLHKLFLNNYEELRNQFFVSLTEEGSYDRNLYQLVMKEYPKDLFDSDFILVRMDIYQMSFSNDFVSEIGRLTEQVTRALNIYGRVESYFTDECLYLVLFYVKPEDEQRIRTVFHVFMESKTQEGYTLPAGISRIHRNIESLYLAYNECLQQIFMAEANIDADSEHNPVRSREMGVQIPYAELDELFHRIALGITEGMGELVEKIYKKPKNGNLLYRDFSYSITFLILLRIYQLQDKYDTKADIIQPSCLDLRYLTRQYPTLDSQKHMVQERLTQLSALSADQGTSQASKMVHAAVDYTNRHFCENISLQDVADEIGISKNYFCDIFKKELGMTFISYVTNLRIEKAKELLTGSDMKMYEISDAVGYNDYAYFSQLFKKHTGQTLSAWRGKA